jgi:serine/threonine-protein kinase
MQKRIGGYELNKLLGEGGMGEVWLAHDTFADRPVALKFIKPHLLANPGFRTRFSNEAKTLGKLEHERIVTLYAVLEEGEHLALVLRFIDGKALSDKIDEQGPLPLSFVYSCARDILPALDFAHQQGIIHRDIKPQNILVDSRDRSFLTDFGIAIAAFAERGTVTGHAIGTPHYMSPEQIRTPREVSIDTGGHRTDIYSYGVVMFEMLTGQLPFGKDSGIEDMYAIYHAHCNEAPGSPRALNPSVPEALDEIVLSCLAKDPADRPQTCLELLERLEGTVADSGRKRTPIAHLGTIVEPAPGTAPKQSEAPVPAGKSSDVKAAPAKTAPARHKIPQAAWLGIGGLLIAGGVGYTVLTPGTKPKPAVDKPKATVTSAPPKHQSAPPHSLNSLTTRTGIRPERTLAVTTPPPEPKSAVPNGPTAEQIAAKQEADKEYATGHSMFQAGNYCGSVAHFNEATKLYPESKYAVEQRSAADGCNSQ